MARSSSIVDLALTHPIPFALAVLALLVVPGPTNTLLAGSGAALGVPRSLRLLIGEVCGYSVAIVFYREVLGSWLGEPGTAQSILKWAIAAYLIFLAIKLWRWTAAGDGLAFTVPRVLVTTLLNPKALIFALIVFPPQPTPIVPYFVGFVVMVVCVGASWILAGSLVTRFTSPRFSAVAPRLCAVAMAAFAFAVVSGVLSR
jgi:threonine/homoserine/homoserine lactone efflux protein